MKKNTPDNWDLDNWKSTLKAHVDITVTSLDMSLGVKKVGTDCPVAFACNRKLKNQYQCNVGYTEIYFRPKGGIMPLESLSIINNTPLTHFIVDFDFFGEDNEDSATFTLEGPAYLMRTYFREEYLHNGRRTEQV